MTKEKGKYKIKRLYYKAEWRRRKIFSILALLTHFIRMQQFVKKQRLVWQKKKHFVAVRRTTIHAIGI